MSKNGPAFQFYAQDFLTGVMYLTNEEIGIYIKLLAKQWTDGKIPLNRIEFLINTKWENVSEELKSKFECDGTFLFNKRLELERKKQQQKSKKAKESAEKRWKKPMKLPLKSTKNESMRTHNKRTSESDAIIEDEDRSMKSEDEIEKRRVKSEKGGVGEKQKIVDVFNSVCQNLPKVQKLTKQRQSAINARTKEYGLEKIGTVFDAVSKSEFLNGGNDRGWKADFDWIMNPNNFIKILEGKYQHGKRKSNNDPKEPRINRQSAETIRRNSQGW